MNKRLLKFGTKVLFGLAVLSVLPFTPAAPFALVRAQVGGGGGETSYGGQRFVTIVCSCASDDWLIFQDYKTNRILNLLYRRGLSMLYEYYNVFSSTYLLGTYREDHPQCQMNAGESCVNISMDGTLGNQPGTGTSAM